MASEAQQRTHTVLFVKDDREQQQILARRLANDRPDVLLLAAGRAQDALRTLETRHVDAVIIDDQLPDRTGLELIGEICAMPHPPTTLMVSAVGDTATAVEAMKLGAQDYLLKGPDHERKLLHALDRAIGTAELRERLRTLSEIARAMVSTFDVEEVFRILGERLQRAVPYKRVVLEILDPSGDQSELRTIVRPPPGQPVVVARSAAPPSPVHDVLESMRPKIVSGADSGSDATLPAGHSYAIVPIVADNKKMGALAVGVGEDARFREQDIALFEDLAAHMAIAIRNARVFADLEHAYVELRDAKDRLVRSEKLQALGEMAAGVAHDFNNLLSAILGRSQMLKVMLKDEAVLKSVGVIEQAALDGARTVWRIQEFAKNRGPHAGAPGEAEGDFTPVDVDALIKDTIERTMTRIRGGHREEIIDVRLELAGECRTFGNPSELRQVLTNLIFNSLDAMPSGGTLAVKSGREGARVWFEVGDSGCGMEPETREKMFNPFFTTKGTRGTGLGLSVSDSIVQRHRGEFDVWSEKGAGTRIRVWLPVENADHTRGPAAPRPPSVPRGSAAPPEPGKNARILVIDDDDAVLDVLADILRTGEHEVVAARSGEDGLARFKSGWFDLVFTDLGMPGMNGWEVAAGVKALRPGTPVGLITGWGASLDEKRMRDRGVDLIVSKPFRYHDVLALVSEAMQLRERSGS